MRPDLVERVGQGDFAPMLQLMNQRLVALDDGSATVTSLPEAKFENSMGPHAWWICCHTHRYGDGLCRDDKSA